MQKFLAVLKREYKKVVVSWTFLITTLLFPLLATLSIVVPTLIFSLGVSQTKLSVADKTGKIASRLIENLAPEEISAKARAAAKESLNDFTASKEDKLKRGVAQIGDSFLFVVYQAEGKSDDTIKTELNGKIQAQEIDGYLIIDEDYKTEFASRKPDDIVTNRLLEGALSDAIRSQRLAEANISEDDVERLSEKTDLAVTALSKTGEEKSRSGGFFSAIIVAFLLYIVLVISGQAIMAAIIEEKETKISEILFSSARPFELMMGKLVGVGLAGITQLAVWIISVLVFAAFGLSTLLASGVELSIPAITAEKILYFFIFFALGYFVYATIYVLIGSMVTTTQEAGPFVMVPVFFLIFGLYFSFAVARDPNSSLAFWTSVAPFLAPIVMPVRILAETPPFWQIFLAIVLNVLTIIGLTWVASRVYRIGMLMYGKRATIPEVWKWIRHS